MFRYGTRVPGSDALQVATAKGRSDGFSRFPGYRTKHWGKKMRGKKMASSTGEGSDSFGTHSFDRSSSDAPITPALPSSSKAEGTLACPATGTASPGSGDLQIATAKGWSDGFAVSFDMRSSSNRDATYRHRGRTRRRDTLVARPARSGRLRRTIAALTQLLLSDCCARRRIEAPAITEQHDRSVVPPWD